MAASMSRRDTLFPHHPGQSLLEEHHVRDRLGASGANSIAIYASRFCFLRRLYNRPLGQLGDLWKGTYEMLENICETS